MESVSPWRSSVVVLSRSGAWRGCPSVIMERSSFRRGSFAPGGGASPSFWGGGSLSLPIYISRFTDLFAKHTLFLPLIGTASLSLAQSLIIIETCRLRRVLRSSGRETRGRGEEKPHVRIRSLLYAVSGIQGLDLLIGQLG